MATRKVVHVVPHERGGWQTKGEGAQRATSVHGTKAEAVAAAKEQAKNAPLGQVKIHKQNGQIQTEHTYGKDPHPPKG